MVGPFFLVNSASSSSTQGPVIGCIQSLFPNQQQPGVNPPLLSAPLCSCAFNRVLYEAEEEDVKPREQPQLLEQRHHHGLLQQARRGAAPRDSRPGERGTAAHPLHQRLLLGSENSQIIHVQSVVSARLGPPLKSSCCRRWNILLGFSLALSYVSP